MRRKFTSHFNSVEVQAEIKTSHNELSIFRSVENVTVHNGIKAPLCCCMPVNCCYLLPILWVGYCQVWLLVPVFK